MNFVITFIIGLILYFTGIDANKDSCCYNQSDIRFLQPPQAFNQWWFNQIKWPKGIIYFDVDAHMDPVIRHYLTLAIDYINNNIPTCVKWKQRFPDPRDTTKYWVTFVQTWDNVTDAPIGWNKTKHNTIVKLGYEYAKGMLGDRLLKYQTSVPDPSDKRGLFYKTLLLHEMTHVMGFDHEHQRLDRDCWIFVSDREIARRANTPDQDLLKFVVERYSTKFPYDKQSVMHIWEERPDIYAHDLSPIGRKDGKISAMDIRKLNYLYCKKPADCDRSLECAKNYHDYRYNTKCVREGKQYNTTTYHCHPCKYVPYAPYGFKQN